MDIIINPVAGAGRAEKVGRQVLKELARRGISFTHCLTEHAGHARELAREAAARGADAVWVIGGDGTAFEASGGLLGTDTALGIIPAGRGNDFCRSLGMAEKPMQALEQLLAGHICQVDAATINGQPFLNVSGTGFDITVLDYAKKYKRLGKLSYLAGVLCAIFKYKPGDMSVQADGQKVGPDHMLVCAVANGAYYGGGIHIAPTADPCDGLLDVITINAMTRPRMLRRLPGLLSGKVLTFPETVHARGKQVVIECPGARFNVDGELTPMSHAVLEVQPKALRVVR